MGKTSRQPGRPRTADAHQPLEEPEADHQQHDEPVLQDVGQRHALPESGGAQRPRARIVSDEHEHAEAEEEERPVPRPARAPRSLEHREHAHGEDEQAGHVVVVLRPRVLLGLALRQRVIDRGGGGKELLHGGRGEPRQLGLEARRHLRRGSAICHHVHRGRERGERRRREQDGDADPDLGLDERPHPGPRRALGDPAAHEEIVEAAQHERARHQRDLGQDHDAVAGADERAEVTDVAEREREAGRQHQPHPDHGEEGEAAEGLGGERRTPGSREVHEPADPQHRAGLVKHRCQHEGAAALEAAHRVREPGGVDEDEEREEGGTQPAAPVRRPGALPRGHGGETQR